MKTTSLYTIPAQVQRVLNALYEANEDKNVAMTEDDRLDAIVQYSDLYNDLVQMCPAVDQLKANDVVVHCKHAHGPKYLVVGLIAEEGQAGEKYICVQANQQIDLSANEVIRIGGQEPVKLAHENNWLQLADSLIPNHKLYLKNRKDE